AGATSGSISNTPFLALDDARVPHPVNATTGAPLAEAATGGSFVVPNSPPSFSTYNGTKVGADFTYGTSIRISSLLEAKYIIAEAEGATAANIAFVESRRLAFPSTTAATPTTAANFLANLIDQRRRDFYLDGHRMGDLRRYLKFYGLNFYPTGAYLGSTTTTYGDTMCWPINTPELTNNPLIPKPYTPPNGP
ncbi:MAG TPA: RagB/SusD family nutrient uptake outer membrane protein, partial [Gemmatimonadaceae bacterium]|nr:RagB/SusD family nutrient uptake outer membrane protein [Gemmatimonadaceae bacterium]